MPFINGYALKASLLNKSILIDAKKRARYLDFNKREYRDELNELAEWKESKGLRVEFAYVGSESVIMLKLIEMRLTNILKIITGKIIIMGFTLYLLVM